MHEVRTFEKKSTFTNHVKINSEAFSKLLQRDFVFNLKHKQDNE